MHSGKSAEMIARELRVCIHDLYKCGRDMQEMKQVEPERKPARVTEQREILYKVASILSQTSPQRVCPNRNDAC